MLIPDIKGYSTIYRLQRQFKVTFHPSSLWTIINETCIFSVMVLLTTTSEAARMTVYAELYPTVLLLLPCEVEIYCQNNKASIQSEVSKLHDFFASEKKNLVGIVSLQVG